MEKHKTRLRLLQQRRELNEAACRQLSLQIQQRLINADCFRQARSLALYSSVNNEVGTEELFCAALKEGKQVCYPRVSGDNQLVFLQVRSLEDLRQGRFGVAEPHGGEQCGVDELDLVVVPGVAFDRQGGRLGYGKGFYDRELSRLTSVTGSVGLCYDFQLCASLPVEAHDRPVSFLVTESQFIPCHKVVAGSP